MRRGARRRSGACATRRRPLLARRPAAVPLAVAGADERRRVWCDGADLLRAARRPARCPTKCCCSRASAISRPVPRAVAGRGRQRSAGSSTSRRRHASAHRRREPRCASAQTRLYDGADARSRSPRRRTSSPLIRRARRRRAAPLLARRRASTPIRSASPPGRSPGCRCGSNGKSSSTARDRLDGWTLGAVDLEPADVGAAGGRARTLRGPQPADHRHRATLGGADQRLAARRGRSATSTNQGEVDEPTEAALDDIADADRASDVVAASLDSLHEQLLGLPVDDCGVCAARTADGRDRQAARPDDVPQLAARRRRSACHARAHRRRVRPHARSAGRASVRVPARDDVDGRTRGARCCGRA